MRLRLPRQRFWRAIIYLVCLILVLVAVDLVLVEARRKIHPNYFTTRITGPLRDDGRIDYLTALEAFFEQGVTPENNAAPLLLRAFGRAALPANQPEDGITDRLGLPHVPKEGSYYITYDDWCKQHSAPQEDDPTDPSDAVRWPIKVSDATAQWIKANEKPLALVAEASQKSRYFIPFNGGTRPWTIVEVLIPHVRFVGEVHRPLLTRALMRLEGGDFDGFREDLLTTHRLARLVAQAPALIERIRAIEQLEIPACRAECAAATSGKLSSKQIKVLADDLAAMGDLPSINDAINISERYMGLDIMQAMSRLSPYRAGEMFNMVVDSGPRIPPAVMRFVPVNYEESLRRINNFHDGALAATQLPAYTQRIAGLKFCEESLAPATKQSEIFKRAWGDWPAAYLLPALMRAHERAEIARMENRLTRIALALALYKLDRGGFPASLAELSPNYLPEVPQDSFSGKPLLYSRTADGFRLYSVGPNATDDAGRSGKPGDDLLVAFP